MRLKWNASGMGREIEWNASGTGCASGMGRGNGRGGVRVVRHTRVVREAR